MATPERWEVLAYVRGQGIRGATRREVMERWLTDGGPISGKLSTLHRDGHLAMLAETRGGRFHVYVAPEYVRERPTREHARNAPCPHCGRRRFDEEGKTWQE